MYQLYLCKGVKKDIFMILGLFVPLKSGKIYLSNGLGLLCILEKVILYIFSN